MISLESPNVDNIPIGKGIVYFKPEGSAGVITDAAYRVGNVTEFELTPNIESLDHFDSQGGVRSKDKSVVLTAGLSVRMIMEEHTPKNMRLMLLGIVDDSNLAAVSLDIMSEQKVRGHLRFVGTNDVGPRWTYNLPVVEFSPSGSLNAISEEWGAIEVTGEVVKTAGTFGTASGDFSATVAPANTLVPSIAGTAQVGETVTAIPGEWTGSPTFTYQWQRDAGSGFAAIVAATASTYVVQVGDVGFPLRVVVTGTNSVGNAVANSAETADVIA